jgi:SAM-dependent methyltransferase
LHASPFDDLASGYDDSFTRSACGTLLRSRVWERLPAVFGARHHLLELGCGTGEDAVRLARAGHRVVATDASAEMIRVARLKALAAGCEDHIEFHQLPIEELDRLPQERPFDGVFSNFGAINCVADVPRLARTLAARLARGAPLMFVVMGRHVPWEWAWYLARGDRTRAFRRMQPGGAEWRGLRIFYPTPKTLTNELAPHFRTTRRGALGFALPPSYAAGWLDSSPHALATLGAIERATSRFTASLGDHFILEARLA